MFFAKCKLKRKKKKDRPKNEARLHFQRYFSAKQKVVQAFFAPTPTSYHVFSISMYSPIFYSGRKKKTHQTPKTQIYINLYEKKPEYPVKIF